MIPITSTASRDAVLPPSQGRSRTPRILIVDDDDLILSSLRTLFDLETDYELHVESNPSRAAALLSSEDFDVVISDFLMPEIDGIRLLETAARLQPRATRILLTGCAEGRRTRTALRDLDACRMEKPWSNRDLLQLVASSLDKKV